MKDKKHMIIIGGCDENNELLKSCEYFNIENKTIVHYGNLNHARKQVGTVIFKDSLYVFGGSINHTFEFHSHSKYIGSDFHLINVTDT